MPKHTPANKSPYENLFKTHPSAMLIVDPESGAIINSNTAAQDFYLYSQEEFTQLNISQINTLKSSDMYLLSGYIKNTDAHRQNVRHRHKLKDGQFKDVLVCTEKFTFEDRTALCSTIKDITGDKDHLSTGTNNKNTIQTMLEASKSLVYLFKIGGEIINVNTRGAKFFDQTPEQMIGENFKRYFNDNDYSRLKIIVDDIVENLSPVNYQKEGRDNRFYDINLHPVLNAQNNVESICAFIYDINDLKKTQEVLAAIDTAGSLCHTMNQPLQVIGGNLELLRLKLDAGESGTGSLEKILFHVEELGTLIRKLSHITRHETKEHMRGTVFDIDKIDNKP